jgi:hypothetical protein
VIEDADDSVLVGGDKLLESAGLVVAHAEHPIGVGIAPDLRGLRSRRDHG